MVGCVPPRPQYRPQSPLKTFTMVTQENGCGAKAADDVTNFTVGVHWRTASGTRPSQAKSPAIRNRQNAAIKHPVSLSLDRAIPLRGEPGHCEPPVGCAASISHLPPPLISFKPVMAHVLLYAGLDQAVNAASRNGLFQKSNSCGRPYSTASSSAKRYCFFRL